MNDKEKDFYSQIGQISVGFSNLESQIKELIFILTRGNDEFVNSILIEDNSISQNLKLLLKLSRYHEIEEDTIKSLHSIINKIRINRNLFIHGLWSLHEDATSMVFICEIRKVEFKKVTLGFMKVLNKFLEFRPYDFDEELLQIKVCLQLSNQIIESLTKTKKW